MSGQRIVIVNDFSVARGGATALALLAAELIAATGREVIYLSGDAGGAERLSRAGIPNPGFGAQSLLARGRASAFVSGLWNGAAARFLSDWIAREGRPDDIYHLHGWSQIFSPAVFSALAGVRDRLVVHAHDFFLACPNGAFWDYGGEAACHRRPLSTACLAARCDRRSSAQKYWRAGRHALRQGAFRFGAAGPEILLIHAGMLPFFERAGFDRGCLTVLPNPVAVAVKPPVNAAANRGFVFVGRLDPEKGALTAARAAAEAGVALRLVGEGPERDAIAALTPPPEMTGWLDRKAVAAEIRRARALVMPSRYAEPFGLVAVEALRQGVPVILPSHALLAADCAATDAGAVYDASEPGALAATLRHLATDDAAVAKMAANASAAAATMATTPSAWCDGLLAAYARTERLPVAAQ
ncbi:MAG: glycosyltransferase family 4 protein [Pseudomonadota bacterium]